jgi:hypothetical protein
MEIRGVLHLNFFSPVKPKTIKNKIIGGNHENQKIREKTRVKQKDHCTFKLWRIG